MSIWSRFFGKRSTVNLAHPRDPVLAEWFGAGQEGVPVTPNTAMGVSAVYACVNVLAETIGAMGCNVRVRSGETVQTAETHPLQPLVADRPNDLMTALEFFEFMVACTALRGDSFARINSNRAGRVTSIDAFEFQNVTVEAEERRVRFKVYGERNERITADEMLRFPFKLQPDGSSLSPIGLHRETFGTSLAARRYQASMLKNNAAPKGAIRFPDHLSDEAVTAIRGSWERRHMGAENAGRLAILDGGMEWQSIGMSNEDAQFVELLQMNTREVARIFRIQPHKIGDLENATFSNIEHQGIEFLTDTILPWVRRLEARMKSWLLIERERADHWIEFDMRGLLRGDRKARAEFYRTMFYVGALNANEIRRMEGLNPREGGDEFFVQSASVPVDSLIDQIENGDTPNED